MLAIISVTALGIFIVLGLGKMVWAIVKEMKKPPKHAQGACPNKGKYPSWRFFDSETYRARRGGSDYDIVFSKCSLCGYDELLHDAGSPLTDVISGYPSLMHP